METKICRIGQIAQIISILIAVNTEKLEILKQKEIQKLDECIEGECAH